MWTITLRSLDGLEKTFEFDGRPPFEWETVCAPQTRLSDIALSEKSVTYKRRRYKMDDFNTSKRTVLYIEDFNSSFPAKGGE